LKSGASAKWMKRDAMTPIPENVQLAIILRNTETASRDARAAFDATQRLVTGIGSRFSGTETRFSGIETRLSAVESRIGGLETRVGGLEEAFEAVARSNYRIETALTDIAARLAPNSGFPN
jgi:hypothetical protein